MKLEIKPITIIAVLIFAAWLIGQPPRRPRAGVTPPPEDAPEPDGKPLDVERVDVRPYARDTIITRN